MEMLKFLDGLETIFEVTNNILDLNKFSNYLK